ncbi:MAG: cytochrome c3 family protein [Longimicrobiales bacterium]|nr:cytochrome c3 family protein [Longimicrobiales bacterium]
MSRRARVRPAAGQWLLGAAALAVGLAAPVEGQLIPRNQDCVSCHLDLEDDVLSAPAREYENDIHIEHGFTCLSCHGVVPAGEHGGAIDPELGFIGRPTREQIPILCGSCHSDITFMKQYNPSMRTDQLAEYWTSEHGQALRQGDPDVATCVSCHPAHSIRPPSDPESSVYPARVPGLCGSCHSDPDVMEGHDLPMDQLDAYRNSVHGHQLYEEEDLSAPACNDCHGNHGATPPGVASVERVCGQCHAVMADHLAESGHDVLFSEADLPGCATCHGNHEILRPGDEDLARVNQEVCVRCHEEGEPETRVLPAMRAMIDSLIVGRERAQAALERAEDLGMEVSQAQFELEEVTNALTKARTAIHAMRVGAVRSEIEAGLEIVRTSLERGEEALWEHEYRRIGLAVSAGFIVLLIAGIALKIRQVERRQTRQGAVSQPGA